jgi:hypothetical protein
MDEWSRSYEAMRRLVAQIEGTGEQMRNVRRLIACTLCEVRMAVPEQSLCTMCDALLPDLVPDHYEEPR